MIPLDSSNCHLLLYLQNSRALILFKVSGMQHASGGASCESAIAYYYYALAALTKIVGFNTTRIVKSREVKITYYWYMVCARGG